MNSPLHILHLEDDLNDAALVRATLAEGKIDCVVNCVQTRAGFVDALERGGIDLVLSDFSLPAFDGLAAAEVVRTGWPLIPFILVSGTLGEEQAVDSLKSGAADYVLKARLFRLIPAVRRAMQEVRERAERRRLEAQLIEVQKMEVIGQLASGVAHDFSNILGIIMGYSELIMSDLGADSSLRRYAEEIRHASDRAARLTGQLLVFSRKQTVQPEVMELNEAVHELDKMLRRLIDEHIELILLPGERAGRILADAGYMGQLLMNLVVNARDAMPNGGKLTIATENVTLSENDARELKGGNSGECVMLSVSDTGTGMTDEVKAHMFEAFFTTKPAGKGTGLGLATCKTIVAQSGGFIRVDSEAGKGTTFRIYFPRVEELPEAADRSLPAGTLPQGVETLLVVEDDPAVLKVTRQALEAHGYTVLCAANGKEGLHVAREHQGPPISLVVTDVVMPNMGGKVMAQWLKISYPDLKVLFISGYTEESGTQGPLEPGFGFLPKPTTVTTLARKVRELLDA
jgi:signal transduction histidine kinase